VASYGYPIVFWNLSELSYEQLLKETDNSIHGFSSLLDFAEFNGRLTANNKQLRDLGGKLRAYVNITYNSQEHIYHLERLFMSVLGSKSGEDNEEVAFVNPGRG